MKFFINSSPYDFNAEPNLPTKLSEMLTYTPHVYVQFSSWYHRAYRYPIIQSITQSLIYVFFWFLGITILLEYGECTTKECPLNRILYPNVRTAIENRFVEMIKNRRNSRNSEEVLEIVSVFPGLNLLSEIILCAKIAQISQKHHIRHVSLIHIMDSQMDSTIHSEDLALINVYLQHMATYAAIISALFSGVQVDVNIQWKSEHIADKHSFVYAIDPGMGTYNFIQGWKTFRSIIFDEYANLKSNNCIFAMEDCITWKEGDLHKTEERYQSFFLGKD
jgi:hypothetical protein